MQKGRRRKIEVPTGDTQPQFELGDADDDMEIRRREREEREERRESRRRGTERGWRERGGKRAPKEERREYELIWIMMQNQLNPDRRRAR